MHCGPQPGLFTADSRSNERNGITVGIASSAWYQLSCGASRLGWLGSWSHRRAASVGEKSVESYKSVIQTSLFSELGHKENVYFLISEITRVEFAIDSLLWGNWTPPSSFLWPAEKNGCVRRKKNANIIGAQRGTQVWLQSFELQFLSWRKCWRAALFSQQLFSLFIVAPGTFHSFRNASKASTCVF